MTTRRPFSGTSVMDFFIRNSRGEFLKQLLEQIDAATAITPLVVVPAHELEEFAVQLNAAAGVEDARASVVNEVGRDHLVLAVTENALEVCLACLLHSRANLLITCRLARPDGEIDYRHSWCRHPKRHAGELSLYLGTNQADRLGGTSGARNGINRGAAAALPIFPRRAIDNLLGCGIAVDRGHQPFLDTKSLLQQNVDDGSEAVGGAACVGNDVMLCRVVFVIIYADDDGDVVPLGRRRNKDLFRSGIKMTF